MQSAQVVVRLRRRRYAVTAQNIAERLIGDMISQIGERADNPVVAQGSIFLGHPNNQPLLRSPHTGMVSSRAAAVTSSRVLRPRRSPISPSRARSACNSRGRPAMRLQDPVLGNQILIPQQQFLLHGRGEMRQDARRPSPGCGKLLPDLLYHNSHSSGRANRLGFQNS